MKQFFSFTLLLLVLSFISGCASLGPDYKTQKVDVEAEWLNYEETNLTTTPPLQIKWWQDAFHDTTLDGLIEIALQENLTLRSAGLRVLQARQKLAITVGNQYPQTQELQGSASRGALFSSSPTEEYDVGFNLSWEADVWGRFQRQIESASSELDATVADYDGVMISLISEIAQNYLLIRTNQTRLELAYQNLELQKESLRITQAKFDAGEVSALDQEQANTLLFNTEATISTIEPTLQQLKNSLAILLGKPPHDMSGLLGEATQIPTVQTDISLGMPQDLLRRRPDIRSSERRLASQSAQIGYAITELYPHFILGGTVGTDVTTQGSNLFKSDYSSWDTFASFQWNIFNYGRLKSNVRLQDAVFQQQLEDYRETVLEAQGEVENAIVAFFASEKQMNAYTQAVGASQRAAELSKLQYQDGLVNFNTVISILQTLAYQEDILAQTQGDTATNLIDVYKSLGGGWEIREDEAPDLLLPDSTYDEMLNRTDYWEGNLPKSSK